MAYMVVGASDVGGATGAIGGVARKSVEVASGINGAVGAGGTNSVGISSYYACSTCAGIGDVGLGGAASSVE